jgi:uncharacterized protein (TIGR02246 family)
VTDDRTVDERAVRDVIDRLYVAFEKYDADAFVADYTDDATSILPGSYRAGREAIRERMAGAFAGPLKGTRPIDVVQSVRFLGSDAAIVISRGSFLLPGETESPDDRWFLATWTLAKQDGRWLVAAFHNCPA